MLGRLSLAALAGLMVLTLASDCQSYISLQRTSCYGYCPAYIVTIFDNGNVVFDGQSFVKSMGIQQSVIPISQYNALQESFISKGFLGFNDEYAEPITDIP